MYIVYKLLVLCKNKLLFTRFISNLQSINKYCTVKSDLNHWCLDL